MSAKRKDSRGIIAGLLLMATAFFFGWQTTGLAIGTSLRMGPCYFPMVLSGLLFLFGALVVIRPAGALGRIAWRSRCFILPTFFFGLTVGRLGFVPALFLTTLIADLASKRMRPLPTLRTWWLPNHRSRQERTLSTPPSSAGESW